jgi:hypothetical protein
LPNSVCWTDLLWYNALMETKPIHKFNFPIREKITRAGESECLYIVKEVEGVKTIIKMPKVDDLAGRDYKFDDDIIQWKSRYGLKRTDLECCMHNPFGGKRYKDKRKDGRDQVTLKEGTTNFFYMSLFYEEEFPVQWYEVKKPFPLRLKEIFKIPSTEVKALTNRIQKQWEDSTGPSNFASFTSEVCEKKMLQAIESGKDKNEMIFETPDGCQVYFKKNVDEDYCKILFYMPPKLFESKIQIFSDEGKMDHFVPLLDSKGNNGYYP